MFRGRCGNICLFRDDVRTHYPLGFTPAGRRGLLYWVANEALREGGLDGAKAFGPEPMWWLFLSCAEDPAGELVRTYLFMADWQRAHPYGLTVFGRDRFAAWLVEHYGLSTDQRWLEPAAWPVPSRPAEDLRLAYDGHEDWQIAHPDAFATPTSAEELLVWLAGPDAGLPTEQRAWCARGCATAPPGNSLSRAPTCWATSASPLGCAFPSPRCLTRWRPPACR